MTRAFVLIALLALAIPTASSAARAKQKPVQISVTLTAPVAGTQIHWYGASPVFQWLMKSSDPKQEGTISLEVSNTPTFTQEVLQQFDCGYTPGPCTSSYQWRNQQPYWYDLADSCADLPPTGTCTAPTTIFYWRVRFEPNGTARKISSAVGSFRRAAPRDRKRPSATAVQGSSSYGRPTRFFYHATDRSGVTRMELELYSGSTVVYGARGNWDRSGDTDERYVDVVLPTAVGPGSYRWCITVYDYSGNRDTDCAPYTITN